MLTQQNNLPNGPAGSSGSPDLGFFQGTGKPQQGLSVGDTRTHLWTVRKSNAQNLRVLHEQWWTRYWAWYRARVKELSDPVDWWRSNEVVPEIFKQIETILPRHIIGMFSGPEWFTVQSTQGLGEPYERAVQSLLMYGVEKMQLFPKLYEALKYALIMGHVWGKVTWKQERGWKVRDIPVMLTDDYGNPSLDEQGRLRISAQQQIDPELVYDDPDFSWVDLWHGWPDPSGHNRWFIEQIDVNYDQLLEAQDETHEFINLDQVTPVSIGPTDNSADFGNEQNTVEGIPYDTTRLSRDGPTVRLWQCWGWVPPQLRGPDGIAWRLQEIANASVVIRDKPMPTPDLKIPYFPIKSIPIPNRLYGESIIRYIGPLQDQMNRIENWRMDEVLQNMWGQYIIDRKAGITDNKLLFQPGGALFVDGNPSDVFFPIPKQAVLPEAYTESANKREQMESASAATPLVQGIMETNRATAHEISTRSQQGNARFELQTMWLDYTVKKELLTRMFKLYQRHLPPNRLLRIVGQPDSMLPLDIAQIQSPVDIVIHSGIFAFNREDKLQDMAQVFTMGTNNPQAGAYLKWYEIWTEIFSDFGWKNPGKFLNSEQFVQQMQQAQQQMQLMMAGGQVLAQEHMDSNKAQAEGQADAGVAVVKGQFDLARERLRADAAVQAAKARPKPAASNSSR